MFSFTKMIFLASLVVAGMVAIKDGRVLEPTGLVGTCSVVESPQRGDTATWEACRAGKLEGRPNLIRKSCTSAGIVKDVEYWRCPTRVESGTPKPST